jgi:hypothetical protein
MKLKKLLLVCGFGLSYSVVFAANANVLEYDNVPITPQSWKEIDLTYDKYVDGKKYTEKFNLLRPIEWLEKRRLNKQSYRLIHLTKEDIGADIIATVVAIKPTNINFNNEIAEKSANYPIIGTFLKYSNQVADYTFENTTTHKRETIQATPEHPFYSIYRHDYVPIGQIWQDSGKYNSKEQLKTYNGSTVILVNAKSHNGKVEAVYNFEVYKAHNYIIGNNGFVVHNAPNCASVHTLSPMQQLAQDGINNIQDEIKNGVFFNLRDMDSGDTLYHYRGMAFRGDGRLPEQVFDNGMPLAEVELTPRVTGLMGDTTFDEGISTSISFASAASYALQNNGLVYVIDLRSTNKAYHVAMNSILGGRSPGIRQLEMNVAENIPKEWIVGAYKMDNKTSMPTFLPNPHYVEQPMGTLGHNFKRLGGNLSDR